MIHIIARRNIVTVFLMATTFLFLLQNSYTDAQDSLLTNGNFRGIAKDLSELDITLIRSSDSIKVSRLGYKFTGSLRVSDVKTETGVPFGKFENGNLTFQFPVFVSFSITNLNNPNSTKSGMSFYKAVIKVEKSKLVCVLERIGSLSPEYKSLTMENISMEGGMPDGSKMLKRYMFILKPRE